MRSGGAQEGFAQLRVGRVDGVSAVLSARARSPMCVLTPRARGRSVWAFTSSLGGGMVAGDSANIRLSVDSGAVCFLGTQASTKIYRCRPGLDCTCALGANVGADAVLVVAPDPVQCFEGAAYEQRQVFELEESASLVLVDWVSAGRLARGERWSFRRYFSRNEVWRGGRIAAIDAIELDSKNGAMEEPFCAGRFNCLATVLMLGPVCEGRARASLDAIGNEPVQKARSLVASGSPVSDGAMLRVAGGSIEEVGQWISGHLRFVREVLADDPWKRKW